MNKTEFVDAFAQETGLTKKAAENAVSAYHKIVEKALKKGDKVAFVGFGTYETSKRAARTGRNPQTGEEMKIKATIVPKFKPGKSLKDAVSK